jgi:hypothetical protein
LRTATIFNLNNLLQLKSACARLSAALILFLAVGATAQTNTLSDAEIQGRQLARQLCDAKPEQNFTNSGVQKIRDQNGKSSNSHLTVRAMVEEDGYRIDYDVGTNSNDRSIEWLTILKSAIGHPTIYYSSQHGVGIPSNVFDGSLLRGNETMIPFAHSDFWIADLGLEFFYWPAQKVLPKTTTLKRGREYTLLESTNPNPATNGYSRVLTWIDKESGGILEAEAYDMNGKLLKDFAPKSFKKVNGQWELQEMEIRNVQTGSRTRLEFDLKK